ncbi:MAG: pantetheine-phosphate adenylyltransferase [Chitinophagales bacterium]|nr:pantetheine-phosphate adenylyltransferase [Bacteroidota bacterium]MBK7568397.1 pantetheine-phosphate adenylyltransferase [Bacteroidota bacterium]MBP8916951.1 pantetheine-phosphate adenylyltransferase [Chitinophagales bacterium]MBP9220172.1 pantetheine-phosphate adenylyltransferase [Chitinophagales bacterium]MBP9795785.1 pantetheine-phosphate adenylyltransferase [Chitinophagales bacterium]
MSKIAVFPGSFDPITLGHVNIIERAMPLFDKIIIAIGVNSQKSGYFTLEQRMNWLQEIYGSTGNVVIESYEGLTVDFCKRQESKYILRGLRGVSDYEYERVIAQTNKTMYPEVETVFILSAPEFSHISSTIVREVLRHKGDISKLVPMVVNRGA